MVSRPRGPYRDRLRSRARTCSALSPGACSASAITSRSTTSPVIVHVASDDSGVCLRAQDNSPYGRARLASLTSWMNCAASSLVITAVVTQAPENVIHTRPVEPWPWRVMMSVAGSPSGVQVGSVPLNVSYGVLTTHCRTAVCLPGRGGVVY
jgi:hypothetical protein